jgi:hypothetical protein
MVEALEALSLDAWTLRFRSDAPWPLEGAGLHAARTLLPGALAALREFKPGPCALVGESFGGTLAALALPELDVLALATLGAPLAANPTEIGAWLRSLPLPPLVVDPRSRATWRTSHVLPLLLGNPPPALEPLSSALAADLLAWSQEGPPLEPTRLRGPLLAVAGAMDRLAPPEAVRPALAGMPSAEFARVGMLRLAVKDPDHGALLRDPGALRLVARWIARHMRT